MPCNMAATLDIDTEGDSALGLEQIEKHNNQFIPPPESICLFIFLSFLSTTALSWCGDSGDRIATRANPNPMAHSAN